MGSASAQGLSTSYEATDLSTLIMLYLLLSKRVLFDLPGFKHALVLFIDI
jgi:hypothetical protein